VKKLLKATRARRRGVYGHELKHIQSIEEQLKKGERGLIKKIRAFEGQGYKNKKLCEAQIKNAHKALEDALWCLIKKGAGHDANPATTKPRKGQPIAPPPGPIREASEKELKESAKSMRKWKYKKFNEGERRRCP
jgi:exonuclease VII small subunit